MVCSNLIFVVVFTLSFAVISMTHPQADFAMGMAGSALHSNKSPGQPVFGANGAGGGNRGNWGAGGIVGVGTNVWESNNRRHSFGGGVAASQSFGRSGGQNWHSKPTYGVGAGYKFKFGK